jgi:hypothetical protein
LYLNWAGILNLKRYVNLCNRSIANLYGSHLSFKEKGGKDFSLPPFVFK